MATDTRGRNRVGVVRRGWSNLRRLIDPRITITEPPSGATVDWNVAVPMRDGIRLRVNVFRPDDGEQHPVLLCAHPYGKDDLPLHHRTRRGGYRVPVQYHLMRSAPLTHSAWTSWESPDPAVWIAKGYVVVNADLRGWGTSDGEPSVLSEQEGIDVHDLVEWAAAQPWSTGRVGMSGVSYLAISQWRGAATRPPHLAAICPWEGFTDFYGDFARPGGILNTGFLWMWSMATKRRSHGRVDLWGPVRRRPSRDEWYAARDSDLEAVDVPALVCGSFSDHDLHTRGSFEGYRRIGSEEKWLYTHRGPKWAVYYSAEAVEAQARFFDHFLRGVDTGITAQPPVRLEIREDRTSVTEVRHLSTWPPPGIRWQDLWCHPGGDGRCGALVHEGEREERGRERSDPGGPAVAVGRRGRVSFVHRFSADTRVVGSMVLTLTVSVRGADDHPVLAGVRKFRMGQEVPFEGSYGYPGDLVTHGMLLVSHRGEGPSRSQPPLPFHPHDRVEPVMPGERVRLRIALLPSATLFRAGDELRLDVQSHWFHARNPVTGQFPAGYRIRARGTCTLHLGPADGCRLTIPVLPDPI